MFGIEQDNVPVADNSFFVSSQSFKRLAAIIEGGGIGRIELQQAVACAERLIKSFKPQKRSSEVVQRISVLRINRYGFLIAGQCMLVPSEFSQQLSFVGPNICIIRIDLQRTIKRLQRGFWIVL